jgi:hypothetical protein
LARYDGAAMQLDHRLIGPVLIAAIALALPATPQAQE